MATRNIKFLPLLAADAADAADAAADAGVRAEFITPPLTVGAQVVLQAKMRALVVLLLGSGPWHRAPSRMRRRWDHGRPRSSSAPSTELFPADGPICKPFPHVSASFAHGRASQSALVSTSRRGLAGNGPACRSPSKTSVATPQTRSGTAGVH